MQRRCGSSGRCVDRERVDTRWEGAQLSSATGLCPRCVHRLRRTLRALPMDVLELNQLVAATGTDHRSKVSGSRELPVPIRLGIVELRANLVTEVWFWAEVVSAATGSALRITWPREQVDLLALRTKAAADFLEIRIADLLGEEVIEGLAGALVLQELHHRVRRVAGRTKLVHRLTPACPWCDARALVRHNGSDRVECEGCGKDIDEKHYSWFVKTLVAQEAAA